jgi:penicillin-binding protein 1B
LRIRIQKGFWTSKYGLTLLGVVFGCAVIAASIFGYYYVKYGHMIDARLSGHILQNTTQIFSAPSEIYPGESLSAEELTTYLQRVGYRPEADDAALGVFSVADNVVGIRPSKLSYFAGSNALQVQFRGKTVKSIRPLGGGSEMAGAEIEPELITNLFDSAREKRRAVRYDDLPPNLVNAILSAEDKRFFEHPGSTLFASSARVERLAARLTAKCQHHHHAGGAYVLLDHGSQLAAENCRNHAELQLAAVSKKQILRCTPTKCTWESRSFSVRGFACQRGLLRQGSAPTVAGECAFLAGSIRAPNYYSSADRRRSAACVAPPCCRRWWKTSTSAKPTSSRRSASR